MKRKPEAPDAAIGHGALGPIQHAQIAHHRPPFAVERVQQVEVNLFDGQPRQLLVQETVEIGGFFDQPARQFGRQLDPLAVAIPQRAAEEWLAGAAMVRPGGIHVVDAAIDGVADHARRFRLVDPRRVAVDGRQPHRAEPQGGWSPVQFAEGAITHDLIPLV